MSPLLLMCTRFGAFRMCRHLLSLGVNAVYFHSTLHRQRPAFEDCDPKTCSLAARQVRSLVWRYAPTPRTKFVQLGCQPRTSRGFREVAARFHRDFPSDVLPALAGIEPRLCNTIGCLPEDNPRTIDPNAPRAYRPTVIAMGNPEIATKRPRNRQLLDSATTSNGLRTAGARADTRSSRRLHPGLIARDIMDLTI